MATAGIRVLIVDDSVVMRGFWTRLLESTPNIRVVGTASNGLAALEVLGRVAADVVVLDLEMPEMDGLTALPKILKIQPGVKVIIASALTTQGSQMAIRALSAGAAECIAKPRALGGGEELVSKVLALAPRERQARESAAREGPRALPVLSRSPVALLIGASTGGPNAISQLLRDLPTGFRPPILLVQHMPAYFTKAFAERLGDETGRPSAEARDGEPVESGRLYVAPGDYHLTVERPRMSLSVRIRLNQEAPESFCRPAVDPLFRSAAQVYGPGALAVVLTGMGEDGRRGAECLRAQGATVLVQDEATSVVWGMPGAVARAGLASAVLPIGELGTSIGNLFGRCDR